MLGVVGYDSAWPINPPSWSLFFELIANIIFFILVSRSPKELNFKYIAIFLFSLFVFYISTAFYTKQLFFGNEWGNWPSGFSRVFYAFAVGVYIYKIYKMEFCANHFRRIHFGFIIVSFIFCFLPTRFTLALMEVTLVFPLIVLTAAYASISGVPRLLFSYLGWISYPIYILHYPFLKVWMHPQYAWNLSPAENIAGAILFCLFMIGVAHVAVRWYDEPVRKYLRRRLLAEKSRSSTIKSERQTGADTAA